MSRILLCFVVMCVLGSIIHAEPPPASVASFENSRPANWTVNFGSWEVSEGVLVARQLDRDQHAAASRWQIPLTDGVVKLKVKLAGATAFHVGFDPAPGQLPKKGHLYSLVVSPAKAELKKHKDKADPQSKDQTLASASNPAKPGTWLLLELTARGDRVAVRLTGEPGAVSELQASDPTFHVAKPAIVFRVIGDAVQLDDVEVQVLKAPAGSTAAEPAVPPM